MTLDRVFKCDRVAIAYLLTRGIKGQNFFRAGFSLPRPDRRYRPWIYLAVRVLPRLCQHWRDHRLELFEASWLSDPTNAFVALVVVSVWQLSGYMILIYVAGFMGLNEDVMEAASIDGATDGVKLKSIILPLMMSSITICLF